MRRIVVLASIFALIAASCGGSSGTESSVTGTAAPSNVPATDPPATDPPTTDPPTTDPPATDPVTTDPPALDPVTITSDDGDLWMAVSGVDAERVAPSIRLLDPSEWPAELAGGDNLSGVKIYELEPDGATFDEPVTVTRKLDINNFADLELGPLDVPFVTMLTQDDAGAYELLGNLTAIRIGGDLYMSGTTSHFSPIITSNEGKSVQSVTPINVLDYSSLNDSSVVDVQKYIDSPIPVSGTLPFSEQLRGLPELSPVVLAGLPLISTSDLLSSPEALAYELTRSDILLLDSIEVAEPLSAGSGVRLEARGGVFSEVPISQAPSAEALIGDSQTELFLTFTFWTLLLAGVELEEVEAVIWELADSVGFTFEVIHLPYGGFPSFTRKTYKDLPSIEPGQHLYGFSYEGDVTTDTRIVDIREAMRVGEDWVVESGIECFCSYSEGLILTTGELPAELMMPGVSNDFWVFAGGDDNVELVMTVTDTQTGMAQVFDVTGAEGALAVDTAAFATAP